MRPRRPAAPYRPEADALFGWSFCRGVYQPLMKLATSYWVYDPTATVNELTFYTVTYKRGPAANPQGTLVHGQEVQVKHGMLFNVTATDKS